MAVAFRMTAILFSVIALSNLSTACDIDDVALYKVTLHTLWNEERFPKDYPKNSPKAEWSPVFGQSHNISYSLYHVGEVARPEVRSFALYGNIEDLVQIGDEDPKVYDQFSAPAITEGTGKTDNMVFVDGSHSTVSMLCRMIPSPDWFIGVDSLNLCVDSSWVDQITLDLEPLDAGASTGITFTAPRWEPNNPEPITRHKPRTPNHPAAGFYYPDLKELPAIAKVEFTKVKEYSTKEINELARKEVITILKEKNKHKALPRTKRIDVIAEEMAEEITRSKEDQLRDLEEDPAGTPGPVSDSDVVVVTNPPTAMSTEKDFDLENMDDVVLAVAQGKKLGLGKHLPRHFRSRLHHAVNKIQPNDCLVSEWSEWSPCSVTCGLGHSHRQRSVIREKKRKGRDCPPLTDRKHCGNIKSCAHVDYF